MPEESEYRKFATETMIEVSKLLITLSSAFLVLSVTLLGALSKPDTDPIQWFVLIIMSWVISVLSIGLGILALGAIATSAHDRKNFDVDEPMTKWLLRGQQVFFVLAFVFFITFAMANKQDRIRDNLPLQTDSGLLGGLGGGREEVLPKTSTLSETP